MEADAPAPDETPVAAMTEDGVALHGEFPRNSRLRAEAMAAAGVTTDDEGLIDDGLIADTKDRLDREAEEAAAQPSDKWTRAKLVKHAEGMGLTVEGDANKTAILAQINAAPAAQQEG